MIFLHALPLFGSKILVKFMSVYVLFCFSTKKSKYPSPLFSTIKIGVFLTWANLSLSGITKDHLTKIQRKVNLV